MEHCTSLCHLCPAYRSKRWPDPPSYLRPYTSNTSSSNSSSRLSTAGWFHTTGGLRSECLSIRIGYVLASTSTNKCRCHNLWGPVTWLKGQTGTSVWMPVCNMHSSRSDLFLSTISIT